MFLRGLVPSVYSSGSKSFHGRITKQGSRWLRWICVEISIHTANGDATFQNLYRRICRRRGLAMAKVAVARKILTVIYAMLKLISRFADTVLGRGNWRRLEH
jgi:transposase